MFGSLYFILIKFQLAVKLAILELMCFVCRIVGRKPLAESQFDCFSLLCCSAVCDCSSAFLLNLYLTFTLLFKVIIYNLIPTIFLVLSIKLI